MIETRFNTKYGESSVTLHETEIAEQEAKLAFSLLERWGMVAASPDGEDSAGRQKLRLSTPEELVGRAFTVAKIAVDHARDNGLMHNMGSLPEPSKES